MSQSFSPPNRRLSITPPPLYDTHSQHITTLKPYLELRHLLSLTWLAYPILSLLFVAFRLQLSNSTAQGAVADAKDDVLASCQAAERAATAAASLPRYMASATNQQISDAVNDTMNGAREALVLALTCMEAIINFVVDIYRSTFLCFLQLVVGGGLDLLISAVQAISGVITSAVNGIRTSIQNDIVSANSVINKTIAEINKVNPFGNINAPQLTVPDLSSLENVTLPAGFESALISLNNSLPSLQQLKQAVDNLIDTPFEDLKADINDTFTGLSLNVSILPVPEQNTISFCGSLDTSSVDDLGADLVKITMIGTVILVALAFLLFLVHCALEWYKWRCMRRHLQYTREAWVTDPTMFHTPLSSHTTPTLVMTDHNLMMLHGASTHPLLTRIANNLSRLFHFTPSQQTHLHWFFHYVFHPPALACFLIGFFGLLSVELQLIAVRPLQDKFNAQVTANVDSFSQTIATQINASMFNQSSQYALAINGHINSVQSTINDGVFGWVNGTTTTLNDTLAAFYSEIQDTVSSVFNGTVLENPVQDFIKCIIGSKVTALEDALTFLHNNLNVNMPRVNESILVLSQSDVNEASQPIAEAAVGSGTNGNDGIIGKLVQRFVESLEEERIMFGVFIGLWFVVVLMALAIIFWHSYGQNWVEQYNRRRWYSKQREGLSDLAISYPVLADEKGHGSPLNARPENQSPSRTSPSQTQQRSSQLPPWNTDRPVFNQASLEQPTARDGNAKLSTKLRDLGGKAFGRDRHGEEDHAVGLVCGDDEGSEHPGWLRRAASKVLKKPVTSRHRPQLTIDTGIASIAQQQEDLPPVDHRVSAVTAAPTSHWSVSPTPASLPPWKSPFNPSQARKPLAVNTVPLRPQPRDSVLPSSVESTYSPSQVVVPQPWKPLVPSPVGVPIGIHNSFVRPTPETPPSASPISQSARRSTNFPNGLTPPAVQYGFSNTSKPPPPIAARFLTKNGYPSVQPAKSGNPFATPFDDEHRVPYPTRQSIPTPTNPFSTAMAL